MAFVCNNPECGAIFPDNEPGRELGRYTRKCPLCKSEDTKRRGARGTYIDYNLMPFREVDNFNWNDLKTGKQPFFKLSTTPEGGKDGVDKVVLHVPAKGRYRAELLVVKPPFKPYYFINRVDYNDNKEAVDALLSDFKGKFVKTDSLTTSPEGDSVLKVEFKNDTQRWMSVYEFFNLNVRIYEAGVTLSRRIMMDYGLVVAPLTNKLYFDIEADPVEKLSINNCKGRVLLICAWDNTGAKFEFLLEEDTDKSEEELLKSFFKLAAQYSTCSGFYSSKFDVPYMQTRADYLMIAVDLDFINFMDMHGIYVDITRVETEEKERFDLDTVGKKEFNLGKLERKSYMDLHEWWEKDRPKLLAYCNRDVEIVKLIDEKFEALDTRLLDCNITFHRADSFMSSIPNIESMVYNELANGYDERVVLPYLPKSFKKKAEGEEKYKGAMVVAPSTGIWGNVVVLDFKSMYNRIMQTWNIGIDTLDPEGDIITADVVDNTGKFLRAGSKFNSKRVSVYSRVLTKLEKRRKEYTIERDKYPLYSDKWEEFDHKQQTLKTKLVSVYGVTGSQDSVLFNRSVAEAITATGQECLRAAIRESEKLGFRVIYGDTDSLFLVFSKTTGNLENTLSAASMLTSILVQKISEYMKQKYHVTEFKIEIEIDKVFTKMLLTKVKKKYVGWLIWKGMFVNPELECSVCKGRFKLSAVLGFDDQMMTNYLRKTKELSEVISTLSTIQVICPKCRSMTLNTEKPLLHLYVAGFETIRSDWVEFARNLQRKTFEMLLDDINREYIINWQRDFVGDMYRGKYDREIRYIKPIKKHLGDYKAQNAQHVRAAKNWQKRTGQEAKIGQYIAYYVLKDDTSEDSLIALVDDNEKIKLPRASYDYIAEHQVRGLLERLDFSEGEIKQVFNPLQDRISKYF